MNPEKHGINMELKNVSHLREFERGFDRERQRERESFARVFREFYNIISLVL